MAKPTLLVLGSTFPKAIGDATPSFVLDLAKEQSKHFDVTVLTPFISGAKRQEVMAGVKVVRYRYWPFAHTLADGAILDNLKAKPWNLIQVPFLILGLIRQLRFFVKSQNPVAIHAHWAIPQGLAAVIAATKTKLLVTTHGGDLYALNFWPVSKLKHSVLTKANAISTVNSEMKKQLLKQGIAEHKITVLPMGVDIAAASAKQLPRVQNQLALVGRLVEKKGIATLIQAVRLGFEAGRLPAGFVLKIAGDGPLANRLREQAEGLPIEFLGSQTKEQVLNLFASSQIALLPSIKAASGDQEGLPVTLLEAAAAGCFVVASDLAGINELVQDRVTGLLVTPGDPEQLLEAILLGLRDKELVAACRAEMLSAVQAFDHALIGEKYCKLLGEL